MNARAASLAHRALLSSAVACSLVTAGCGGKVLAPVGGTWTYSEPACGLTPLLKIAVDLEDDGSVEETLTFGAPITGAMHVSGLSWNASSNTMTISGTPSCSGGFTAPNGSSPPDVPSYKPFVTRLTPNLMCGSPILFISSELDPNAACQPMPTMVLGSACSFSLSNDGNILTLGHCEESIPPTGGGSNVYPGLPEGGPRTEYVDYMLHAD
jgi:hypothetical protein